MTKRVLFWLHAVPAIMLVMALGKWSYGYYELLRFVVCACAGAVAYWRYRRTAAIGRWTKLLIGIAILMNPFLPIHLPRAVWAVLNILTAAVLMAHYTDARDRLPTQGNDTRSPPPL